VNYLIAILLVLSCSACTLDSGKGSGVQPPVALEQAQVTAQCPGTVALPTAVAGAFEKIEDDALLQSALGQPKKGGLCQGQVYQTKKDTRVIVYRAWNSTNPSSQMGNWWAFHIPEGKVSQYRSDYEICYQWSPLDTMTHCTLKADTKVVIGTGQSAECSPYLLYPASTKIQIYIKDAASSVADCAVYDGEFSWKAVAP
jgi:hypothetical protein